MPDPILTAFLKQQSLEGQALAHSSDLLELVPLQGDPPQRYVARLGCRGLATDPAGRIHEHDRWAVGIWFPGDYLRRGAVTTRVLTNLTAGVQPWHPNMAGPFICLRLTNGTPLVQILYGLWDLLTWNSYSTADEGLNHAASQWARQQQPDHFPIDRRPLKRLPARIDRNVTTPARTA